MIVRDPHRAMPTPASVRLRRIGSKETHEAAGLFTPLLEYLGIPGDVLAVIATATLAAVGIALRAIYREQVRRTGTMPLRQALAVQLQSEHFFDNYHRCQFRCKKGMDLSRFDAAPGARLSDLALECDRAFPTQG